MSPVAAARRSSRPLIAVLGVIAIVSIAARWQAPVGTAPAAKPAPAAPAVTPVAPQDSMAAADTTQKDSLAIDSLATDSLMADSALAASPTVEAAPASPAAWPVDSVTGYTLVNGIPVVGRAFVMKKTDGLVKVETVAEDRVNEALPPEAPIVGSSYTAAPATATRRFRGIMVQATLWSIDGKRSSIERRHYRPSAQ